MPLVPVSLNVSFGSNGTIISYQNDESDSGDTIAFNTSDSEQTIEYKMLADKWDNEQCKEYKTRSGWTRSEETKKIQINLLSIHTGKSYDID